MARRAVDPIDGALLPIRYVLHDRDTKFCAPFRDTLRSAGVRPLTLPARSPNLNPFAERWVRSIKSECLSRLISSGKARCVEQSLNSLRIIISNVPIKAKLISCSSLPVFAHHHHMLVASNVTNASADSSSFINAPHEYFDPTGSYHSLSKPSDGWTTLLTMPRPN